MTVKVLYFDSVYPEFKEIMQEQNKRSFELLYWVEMINGAAIDTWATEPISADNPLLKLDNVIATPHIGAGIRDTLANVLSMSFRNFESIEDGQEPEYVVNNVNKGRVGTQKF